MKILFLGRRYTYFKNFDSVIRELAARGHELHLAVERDTPEGRSLVDGLASEHPSITYGEAPDRSDDEWTWVATRLRHGLEYLRYQHPLFDDTPKLRERSEERTPGIFVALGRVIRRYARWARRPLSALLRWLERAVPDDPAIAAFIEEHQPDIVLITPLVNLGSSQIDYLRAARVRGLPTALCVWSWDHLSSKALIRERPDRVFVWNDTQKHEAIALHGVPADRIVVTGAQCFDQWFGREPSRSREAFCAEVGLPADRPFILYVCSAPFIGSAPEAPFVLEWIRRARESTPLLRRTPILVRPHPSRRPEWEGIDLRQFPDVVLWGGDHPVDRGSRDDYFDSLYHSAVVAGLNTSAFIEAGILGRSVHTILLPEWYESQLGTVHFKYLFEAGGGLLNSAATFDGHFRQIDEALARPSAEIRPFVRAFVRPHGLDIPATPAFAANVEEMQQLPVDPFRSPRFEGLARAVLSRVIQWRDDEAHEGWLYSERELETIARLRTFRQGKNERSSHLKRRRLAHKERREAARRSDLERHRAVKKARERGFSYEERG